MESHSGKSKKKLNGLMRKKTLKCYQHLRDTFEDTNTLQTSIIILNYYCLRVKAIQKIYKKFFIERSPYE